MKKIEHLFIVGAGFSHHAGLPLTADFTKELLNVGDLDPDEPSPLMAEFLRTFINDTFDHELSAKPEYWPYLEDVFTCVDLAANTGHHLGPKYSPSQLRTVRRALIARIIRMLRQAYTRGKKNRSRSWTNLEHFFGSVDLGKSAFLSMNWDTVIEEGLIGAQHTEAFDYGCDATRAKFLPKGKMKTERLSGAGIPLIKMHGSSNWLYCDVCRRVYWVNPSSTFRIATMLFKERDWKTVNDFIGRGGDQRIADWRCPSCGASALSTRLATFSYRKALNFPMYERSWLSAERLLRQSKTWIFIGYSLPEADYEFKHLLKHVQLARRVPPMMILITGGDGAERTRLNYQKFFGPKITPLSRTYFSNGLTTPAMNRLSEIGALK